MLMQTLKAYKHLLEAYEIKHVYACATSAMRDAKNSKDIIRKVKLETGIEIKVISGQEEASFIYENHVAENLDSDHSYLYIDVGGGSTELTFFANGSLVSKESFNIGTIRLLKNQIKEKAWDDMKDYVKKHIKSELPSIAIGSGGNITKILSMSRLKEGKPLSLDLLKDYYKELSSVSLDERMRLFGLKEDRADVIVPALLIYVQIMKWASIDAIYVPKIGLVDGLIHHLYDQVGNIAVT
jgi:exopolyphosphatase/guanosine-5'-triphosphate,3'-diphosphate pyrophosphatase